MRGGKRQVGAAHLRSKIVANKLTNSARRLQKDYKELRDAAVPLVGVAAAPQENSFFVWCANIRGPESTAFHGGVFHMEITFPQNYPVDPPSIRLKTTIPHPNVFGNTICLDMLQPKKKDSSWYDGWSSAYTVEAVLIQLQSFLFEVPRKLRDIENAKETESVSDFGGIDERNKYKKAVDEANEYKCTVCRHRGPIEPFPAFSEKENDESAFVVIRDPKVMLSEEFLCYHTRSRLPECSLGIGVSLSRLPRTGELRSVTPTLDLLSLRAFTKQKVRKAIDNSRFTHWLPLYFGERQPYEVTVQNYDEEAKEFVSETKTIDPRERVIKLLMHSLSFISKGSTTKELTADMILEILPKLIITHMVEMADERKHISILAIRRLVNFIRLFRLTMELKHPVATQINEKLAEFKASTENRIKDKTASLGDILAISLVSDQHDMTTFLESYLEEQLDRQAFWILRIVPELDHTDEKYKNKLVTLEDAREEVCFKTGLTGFNITMMFFTFTQMFNKRYEGRNFAAFEAALDDNLGCLPMDMENELQAKLKKIQRVDTFQKYYQWLEMDCPDSEALQQRLHKAISNSKEKKYHGSSEHMNELPELPDQIREHLMADPSPFVHYNEATKQFVDGANPDWKKFCMKKFNWVFRAVEQGMYDQTPGEIATQSDKNVNDFETERTLQTYINDLESPDYQPDKMSKERIYEEYPATFSWRDLYHKLCFEQMLSNFDKLLDFEVFYDYVNKIGSSQEVLRIQTLDKTKLKSNHYWIMVLMSKLTKLRVVKLHGNTNIHCGPDFYKFLLKGLKYMANEGRQLEKIQMNGMIGNTTTSSDYLYPCLKPNSNLISLDFSHNNLQIDDAKALGKVLADFRQIRELNLDDAGLNESTTKEIADGLMRAKQLEILILKNNCTMGSKVSTIIYNLAFSPKIRHIDLSYTVCASADVAEAIFKLIKISGAIEVLNLGITGINNHLSSDFYAALGENKTLKYINLDTVSPFSSSRNIQLFGKAVAMNAYKNGALEALSLAGCFDTRSKYCTFYRSFYISNKDHEELYGDKKLAQEMEKEDLEPSLHYNLKYLNIENSSCGGSATNFKEILKQVKPDWPKILELVAKCPMTLNFKRTNMKAKDMELVAYMLADNPFGECKITSLSLQQNAFNKEGARYLAPALKLNKSLVTLNLSSCKLGVSGMVNICESLQTNNTIKNLSLYRNVFDVDGARALGTALKTNTSLKFLDLGHNRIRLTGLKSITEGILANPASQVSEMSIKWNFITDEGFSYLFDAIVFPKTGRTHMLKKLWIKNNFMSEFHKIELARRLDETTLTSQIYVDDFEGVNLLSKEFSDRSVWVAPMHYSMINMKNNISSFFSVSNKCGFVIDVRLAKGRDVPGRTKDNVFCIIEYAHENSVPRSLKLASQKKAVLGGQPVRIYKAGTKTAVTMPSQRRRGI